MNANPQKRPERAKYHNECNDFALTGRSGFCLAFLPEALPSGWII
jgi:hypothetical protein